MSSYGSDPNRVTLRRALHWIFPDPCLACAADEASRSDPALGLCSDCRRLLMPAPDTCCLGCGRPLDGAVGATPRCGPCRERPPAWEALVWAWAYAEPLDASIGALKFRRLDYLGSALGRAAADAAGRRLRGPGVEIARCDLVTPVPLHWRRRWVRGYDQAALIAEGVAAELGLPFAELLRRQRPTTPQSLTTNAGHRRRLADAFVCRRTATPTGRRILLVDDVVTTGATLEAAARALIAAGARVVAFAAARTPKPDERWPGGPNPERSLASQVSTS